MTEWSEHTLVFECAGEQLLGVAHRGKASTGVVVVVGGPQYRVGSHRQFVLMARDLAKAGYPVFRFDYRGMGDSGGAPCNFERVDADIRTAIDTFMKHEPRLKSVVLWGLCDAASACLMYAGTDPRVQAIIVANPWVHTEAGAATAYIKRYYGQRLLQRSFWAKVVKGELNLRASVVDLARKLVRASSGASGKQQSSQPFIERMRAGFQRFTRPVLLLMSGNDLTAQEFRDLCRTNADWAKLCARPTLRTVELKDADHTFSSRESLNEATGRCLEWLRDQVRG